MICVDYLKSCKPTPKWRWNKHAHLFVVDGTEETLHAFAKRLGLKRSWFQDDHYDLSPTKHILAIDLGANLVDRRSEQMRSFFLNRIRGANRHVKQLKENR